MPPVWHSESNGMALKQLWQYTASNWITQTNHNLVPFVNAACINKITCSLYNVVLSVTRYLASGVNVYKH